jgi:hypothetical protein
MDESNAPGIKTFEEELMKRTGVDGFFEVHQILRKHCDRSW